MGGKGSKPSGGQPAAADAHPDAPPAQGSAIMDYVDRLFEPMPVDKVMKGGSGRQDAATSSAKNYHLAGGGGEAGSLMHPREEPGYYPGDGGEVVAAPISLTSSYPAGRSSRRAPAPAPGPQPSQGQLRDSYQWSSSSPMVAAEQKSPRRWVEGFGSARPIPRYAEDYYRSCDVLCRYCGALVYDGYQFCPHCGSPASRLEGPDFVSPAFHPTALPRGVVRSRSFSPSYVPVISREHLGAPMPRYREPGFSPRRYRSPPRGVVREVLPARAVPPMVAPAPFPALRPTTSMVLPAPGPPPVLPSASTTTVVLPGPPPVPQSAPTTAVMLPVPQQPPIPTMPNLRGVNPLATHQLVKKKYTIDNNGDMAEVSRQPIATTALGGPAAFGAPPATLLTTSVL
mmetsp:Transcript_56/g.152  ORF Transcript_56/g.152 Transcript_56/m.152 type:complete len:398 (+) Transcript_56:65-1258(+)